ncbi:MAG: DUF501 domain-containing protein [Actinomycetota bacterium]
MDPHDDDRRVVGVQIGREPRGDVAVAVRCEYGLPMVVRTSPTLETGEPFPTLYWLSCPLAVRAVGKLESTGRMRDLNDRLASESELAESYRTAHERYRSDRDGDIGGRDESAGGMPGRVKCLHALYAHELADANPIGAIVRENVEPLGCPGSCVETTDDGATAPVTGHPGFARARRR